MVDVDQMDRSSGCGPEDTGSSPAVHTKIFPINYDIECRLTEYTVYWDEWVVSNGYTLFHAHLEVPYNPNPSSGRARNTRFTHIEKNKHLEYHKCGYCGKKIPDGIKMLILFRKIDKLL